MSRPLVVLALLAVAASLTGLALLVGSDDGTASPRGVHWAERPRVVTPPELPTDRVLYGQVRNDAPRAVTLRAGAVRVVDGAGRPLRSDVRFLPAFARGAAADVTLAPGRTAPITVAWRGGGARRVVVGSAALRIP